MADAITLNGTAFLASDIQMDIVRIGVSLVSASGARKFVVRGASLTRKRRWTIALNGQNATQRGGLLTITGLTSTFVYEDPYSNAFTVQCEDEPYSEGVGYVAGDGDTLYWDITLVVFEA